MVKLDYSIKSRELKRFLDLKVGNNVLFFKALSKITSLYNLSAHGHEYARYELYRIITKLEKLKTDYTKDITRISNSLKRYKVDLKPQRKIEINLANPVNNYLFKLTIQVDLFKSYDTLFFIKKGQLNKGSLLYDYLKEIKLIISEIYKLNIKNIIDSTINDNQKAVFEASFGHDLLPALKNKNNEEQVI